MTTTHGRIHVTPSAVLALTVQTNAPVRVRLWVGEWYNRERVHRPVYFAYTREECAVGRATLLPMDSTVFELLLDPNTQLWVVGEDNVLLNYAVDRVGE